MKLCRAQGVLSFETTKDGYKILFGSAPTAKPKDTKDDPRSAKRQLYFDQLGRHLTDAELDMFP